MREQGRETALAPRRSRCTSCAKTHVLLPDTTLLRRRDALVSIGTALLQTGVPQLVGIFESAL